MPASDSDPRYTAKLRLIQLHYEGMAERLDWTPSRFRRLAGGMCLTVHELGAFIRLTPSQTDLYLRKGAFPPPIELHLSMIEQTLLPTSKPSPFPDFPCLSTTTS